jgi:signal transduction histidine kinase
VSLLAKGEGVKDSRHAIEVIQRNAEMQAKLIEDLLELNRLALGTTRLEIAPTDIGAVLLTAVESLKPTAEAKHVQIATSVASALPQIQADHQRVQQILVNLLHNAVKFTGSGGTVATRTDTFASSFRTRDGVSHPISFRLCSIDSGKLIHRLRAERHGDLELGSLSPSIWSNFMADRSTPRVPVLIRGRPLLWNCRCSFRPA